MKRKVNRRTFDQIRAEERRKYARIANGLAASYRAKDMGEGARALEVLADDLTHGLSEPETDGAKAGMMGGGLVEGVE